MTKLTCKLLVLFLFMMQLATACLLASAADKPMEPFVSSESKDDALRAQALLDKAVTYYNANSKDALAEFSLVGKFIDGDLYVYVVSEDGVMLASGGPSVALVGRNVRKFKDVDGKELFAEILDGAKKNGGGKVEYRWLNREHGKVEHKVTYYRKVSDVIVAVGYYIPRGASQAAKTLLARAVEAIKNDPEDAIARFDDMNGGFVEDDLYVFVVGIKDGVMHAHGAMPKLIGRKVDNLLSDDGKPIIRQMINIAKAKVRGELSYTWPNPVTGLHEHKTTYLQRVGDYLVAVGY